MEYPVFYIIFAQFFFFSINQMFNFKTLAFLFTNLEVQSPMQDPQHPVQKYSFIKFHETIKKKKKKTVNTT